jgi:hypothetical protein
MKEARAGDVGESFFPFLAEGEKVCLGSSCLAGNG